MRNSRPALFRGNYFSDEIIVFCVRWYPFFAEKAGRLVVYHYGLHSRIRFLTCIATTTEAPTRTLPLNCER
jgi:hypothetical protein